MSRVRRQRRSRATGVELVRLALGAGHLAQAGTTGAAHPVFHRVIGVRQVAQALLLVRSGSAEAHTLGAVVDAAHAVTMLPLALDPRHRRLATTQFWLALALLVAEVVVVGTGKRR